MLPSFLPGNNWTCSISFLHSFERIGSPLPSSTAILSVPIAGRLTGESFVDHPLIMLTLPRLTHLGSLVCYLRVALTKESFRHLFLWKGSGNKPIKSCSVWFVEHIHKHTHPHKAAERIIIHGYSLPRVRWTHKRLSRLQHLRHKIIQQNREKRDSTLTLTVTLQISIVGFCNQLRLIFALHICVLALRSYAFLVCHRYANCLHLHRTVESMLRT